jgi:hypothetical protein
VYQYPFFVKIQIHTRNRLHLKKNVLYSEPCNGGGTGETGSPPFRRRDDRQARRERKFSLRGRKISTSLPGSNVRKYGPSSTGRGAQPTRKTRTVRTQNPPSCPRALFGVTGG